jgi:DNA-binding LytR/AlgR family response regulator
MKYIIIEDEPLASERVKTFAGHLPYLEFCAAFENAIEATLYLAKNRVDLIFLDLNIGEISGMRFLEIVRPDCAVIVLTAYHEYAIKGFDLHVTDYLLKPFTLERFCLAVSRANPPKPISKEFIFIKAQYKLEKVRLDDLLYIVGARDYRHLFITDRNLTTLETFTQLEDKLPNDRFMRVHKSYLVALDKITSMEKDTILIAGRLIPVSATYRKTLLGKIL